MASEILKPITLAQIASLPESSDDVVETGRVEQIETDEGNKSAAPKPVPRWVRTAK